MGDAGSITSAKAALGEARHLYAEDDPALVYYRFVLALVSMRRDPVGAMQLFRSHRPDIPNGGERRDFVYVDDAVAVVLWLLASPSVSGIFNVGTGRARSFGDLAAALFAALGREPRIEYIDMPQAIRGVSGTAVLARPWVKRYRPMREKSAVL